MWKAGAAGKGERIMQYLINAYDGENMLERRMAVRPRHLENMSTVKGKILIDSEA